MIVSTLIALILTFVIFSTINRMFSNKFLQDGMIIPYKKLMQIPPAPRHPIHIFFHICTQGAYWKQIMESEMRCIINSGLYDKCHTLWYGCSCNDCTNILQEYFKYYKKIRPLPEGLRPNEKTYENSSLNSMIMICKNLPYNAHCLYIHTKGTSAKSLPQHSWRDYMLYWLVTRHDIALNLLQRGFFTAGTLYQNLPINVLGYKRFYAGNFFWASSNYISSLTPIHNLSNRFAAEQLLFRNYTPGKHVSIIPETRISLYIPFKTGLYKDFVNVDNKIKDEHIEIIVT